MEPALVPLRALKEPPVVVMTDAEGNGGIGVLVALPSGHLFYAYGIVPPWLIELIESFRRRGTYICQYELIAAVCAYLTFPELLRGRPIHHFVDNQPALSGLIKGSSGLPDSALIIHAFYTEVAALGCRPWLNFVYSEDNGSDIPSRAFGRSAWHSELCAMAAAAQLRLVEPPTPLRFPRLAGWR